MPSTVHRRRKSGFAKTRKRIGSSLPINIQPVTVILKNPMANPLFPLIKSTRRRFINGKWCKGKGGKMTGGDWGTGSATNTIPDPGLTGALQNNVYQLNTYQDDPSTMSISARNIVGGKSKKMKGTRTKKMKGGSTGLLGYLSDNVSDLLYGSTSNPVINFGSSTGSVFTQQLMANSSTASNLVNNQPALSFYNPYNNPIV